MKVTILQEFRDKDDFSKVYIPGTVADFTASRAKELHKRKLVEPLEPFSEESPESEKSTRGRKSKEQ